MLLVNAATAGYGRCSKAQFGFSSPIRLQLATLLRRDAQAYQPFFSISQSYLNAAEALFTICLI